MTILPAIAVTLASIIVILAILAAILAGAYFRLRFALVQVQPDAPLDETLSDVPEGSATSLPADFHSLHDRS